MCGEQHSWKNGFEGNYIDPQSKRPDFSFCVQVLDRIKIKDRIELLCHSVQKHAGVSVHTTIR